LKLNRRKKNY